MNVFTLAPPRENLAEGRPVGSAAETAHFLRNPTEDASDPVADLTGTGRDPAKLQGRQERYDAYLQSAAWRDSPARLAELRLSGGRCRLCARGTPDVRVEVHHRSYERFGRELASDLCALCGDCHGFVTAELRRRRYAVAPLPPCPDTPRVLRDRLPTDLTWSMPDGT